mmetsp:Transcript_11433/g.18612  ORF Transcript_11433/g.18612 Transcript_11433/m.18612 type:complete len:114 (-) Transcript_11433:39-380(-)|eukprot:CAMPEP_0203776712 /NCGR_PEP_ID=MMETSP0099_2-20121227/6922_1 /ASSEMBLY_ACC=CAM_ASM_000209 /TAXON_ID=96639 /ORGANISM=" , Strain NY0313808BC1" /LENGTH=113 /DNA_ID=CAMNT_0050675797 /DNA_START=94 /DNA_END=435 /DNA_ORIENTATION=+
MQAPTPGVNEEPELYDQRSVMFNVKAVAYVRTILTIAAGFAAGVLGLTGFKGFALYLVLYVSASLLMVAKMGDPVSKYIPKTGTASFLLGGIGGEGLAFVLYWTLSYALVHIY